MGGPGSVPDRRHRDSAGKLAANPAELLRISKQRGAIAEGLAADIIAMPANPLGDIESLRKVNFVMKDGKVVRAPK